MKVLHIYKTYLPENFTGVPRVIWQLAEGTKKFGIESHVLSLGSNPTIEPVQIGSHFSHQAKRDAQIASTSLSWSVFRKFHRLVADMDVLHFHFPWPEGDLLALSERGGKPALVTYHSDIVRQKFLRIFYKPLMHKFLGSMDKIVATSPPYAKSSPVLARYAEKTLTIPLGMEARTPPAPEMVESWRRRMGENFFLFVGALRYYKGLSFLLAAARQNGLPVVIAGAGDLGAELKQCAPKNVRFTGEISDADKEALLELSAAFVFPSMVRSEAFGLALVEAARAGKAMISCEIGTGTSFINLNEVTGLVVAPSNGPALAEAMAWMMQNPVRRREMGAAAKQRYFELFRAEDMCASYAQLYEELAGGG